MSNINTRLTTAKKNIINTAALPRTGVIDKLTDYSKGFLDFVQGKTKEITTPFRNNTKSSEHSNENIFTNPMVIFVLLVVTLVFLGYGIYYYFKRNTTIQAGKSFYGPDILTYDPLFKMNSDNIDKCIERCEKDKLCKGLTFNMDEQTCLGSREGLLRTDESTISAWVKQDDKEPEKAIDSEILVGYVADFRSIDASKIIQPGNPYEFNWSFVLHIRDSYSNHGIWRHIMHKGTDMLDPVKTPNWEDILMDVPDQSIGVWMSPFNNNLRIALTTTTPTYDGVHMVYEHAMTQNKDMTITDTLYDNKIKPKTKGYTKNIEFVDLPQFPINRPVHLSINIIHNTMEIYKDARLVKVYTLAGFPEFNKGNVFLLKSPTVAAELFNVAWTPSSLKLPSLKALSELGVKAS